MSHDNDPSPPSPSSGTGTLHFTIGAAPSEGVSLDKDLRMVKAALLYADGVKLCSFTSSLFLFALHVAEYTPEQQLQFIELMIPQMYTDETESAAAMADLKTYRRLRRQRRYTKDELFLRHKLDAIYRERWKQVREAIHRMANEAGADGLIAALQSGLLELYTFRVSSSEELAREFFNVIKDAVSEGSTYPLLDDQAANLKGWE